MARTTVHSVNRSISSSGSADYYTGTWFAIALGVVSFIILSLIIITETEKYFRRRRDVARFNADKK